MICHPEHDKMVAGKKVALIGSGATAVTILPSVAASAEHVTMVQRTPTYIRCKPEIDPVAEFMIRWLPTWLADRMIRWRAVLLNAYFYQYCIRYAYLCASGTSTPSFTSPLDPQVPRSCQETNRGWHVQASAGSHVQGRISEAFLAAL